MVFPVVSKRREISEALPSVAPGHRGFDYINFLADLSAFLDELCFVALLNIFSGEGDD